MLHTSLRNPVNDTVIDFPDSSQNFIIVARADLSHGRNSVPRSRSIIVSVSLKFDTIPQNVFD